MTIQPIDPAPEPNPYAAPEAALGKVPDNPAATPRLAEAEDLRRQHIAREALIKLLGTLHLVLTVLASVFLLQLLLKPLGAGAARSEVSLAGRLVTLLVVADINLALGLGLRGLRSWARWLDVVVLALCLQANAATLWTSSDIGQFEAPLVFLTIGSVLPIALLYVLISRGSAVVFSQEYREVVERTPHIRVKAGRFARALVIGVVLILLFSTVASLLLGVMYVESPPGRWP